jgi:hypothetical protein
MGFQQHESTTYYIICDENITKKDVVKMACEECMETGESYSCDWVPEWSYIMNDMVVDTDDIDDAIRLMKIRELKKSLVYHEECIRGTKEKIHRLEKEMRF